MVAPLLENAPADALVLADWHWATPMWYLQQIEGLRPDVEVRYVYNVAGEDYRETWRRHIEANDPERSLILTHFYEFDGYTTEPWQTVYLIRRRPVTQPVGALSSLDTIFDGHLRVLGFSVQLAAVQPGEPIECVLAWQALAEMNGTESFTLRLLDDGGNRVAQADRSLMSTSSGEVRFERLVLPVYPTLPPGTYQLALGTYTVTEAGFSDLLTGEGAAVAPLGAVEVEPRSTAPFTLRRQWVSFRAGPTLVGVDYDRSVEGTLRVYLHWQGPVEPGWQARLRADEGSEAAVRLPAMQAGTYQTVAIDLPAPAASTLRLALVSPSGAVAVGAGPAGWALGEVALPRARAGDRFVALGDEMAVVGVSAQAAAPGETTVVDVTLVGLHALTRDISTSVRLVASDGRWLARHDMQPALGAVPTLKWIRGSRVVDRHLLPMPVDADVRDVQMTLVAYERFGLATLPPMDARFGEVPLGAWSQP